jgi:DNA-binding IclR family transcriptional regulator
MPARNYIELIEKATRVLEVLAKGEGRLSLKQIAEDAELVKSSTFRILFTLRELGYVEQDAERGTYRLSLKILSLARGAAAKATLTNIARPFMEELRDRLGESVWLAERRAHGVLLVDEAASNHPIRLLLRVGDESPIHASAVGKSIAAFMDKDELEDALDWYRLTKFTQRTITARSEVLKHIADVREAGYALNDEETIEGALVAGAPIFDSNHRVCAAVSVAAPAARSAVGERELMISGVVECGRRITRALSDLAYESVADTSRVRERLAVR